MFCKEFPLFAGKLSELMGIGKKNHAYNGKYSLIKGNIAIVNGVSRKNR